MQELEKILEEIKEALEENKVIELNGDGTVNRYIIDVASAWGSIKAIIHNHINDGWIPVERGLPEVFGKYWATIRYSDGRISEPVVVDFRGVRQKYVVNTPNGREYETWGIDSAFHGSRVIAWKPYYIPESYRPERSVEE